MDLYEVTKRLIGPTDPVGESRDDEIRFENLKEMTNLVYRLINDIERIAVENENRNESSIKKAGKFSRSFICSIHSAPPDAQDNRAEGSGLANCWALSIKPGS